MNDVALPLVVIILSIKPNKYHLNMAKVAEWASNSEIENRLTVIKELLGSSTGYDCHSSRSLAIKRPEASKQRDQRGKKNQGEDRS